MPSLCLPFRCCNVLVRAMPTHCPTKPEHHSAMPVLNSGQPRQCFARPCVAYAPIVAVAGDCSAVPTHCSPMPMLRFGLRPCRASLHRCLAEHNFAIAALYRTERAFALAMPFTPVPPRSYALPTRCYASPSQNRSELCLAFALRTVAFLCPRDSKLLCAGARQWTACHRRSAACHLSVLPCPRCAIP